jgi:hypothetical protein
VVEQRLQRLGDHGLDGQHADGQFDAQHVVDQAGTVAAGAHQHLVGVDFAAGGVHAGDLAAFGVDGGGFGVLVDVDAVLGAALGQPPDHGVVAHDAAGGVVHGPVDGKGDILGDVQGRHQFLGLLGVDEVAFHAVKLGGGDGHAGRLHGRFAVHQVQVAAVVEHQVEIQLLGEHRPQVQRLFVQRNVVLGALVGPHDGGVSAGAAEADVALLNNRPHPSCRVPWPGSRPWPDRADRRR